MEGKGHNDRGWKQINGALPKAALEFSYTS